MRSIINGKLNIGALIIGLAAFIASAEAISAAPEEWRPYMIAFGAAFAFATGNLPGGTPPSAAPVAAVTNVLNDTRSHPAVPTTTDLLRRRGQAAGGLMLVLALLAGCGSAQLVTAETTGVQLSGDFAFSGSATLGEPSEWSGAGGLDTSAAFELCVKRGGIMPPICTQAVLGLLIKHRDDGAVVAICWEAAGGLIGDCVVRPLVNEATE